MTAPVQDAPATLKIDPNGTVLLSIPDHDGKEVEYLMELAPRGFAVWAVKLTRLDGKDGPYRVEMLAPGRWACDCGDSRFGARKQGRFCKHRTATRNIYRLIERLGVHDRPETEEGERAATGTVQ